MMHAAPELSPTLDDALRALDDFPGRPADVATAARFLEELDQVRAPTGVVLDQLQAELLEGAYQAGFRTADQAGQVLVVSLPAFLAYVGAATPARPVTWGGKLEHVAGVVLRRPAAFMAGAFALSALVAGLVDQDAEAAAWLMFGAAGWAFLEAFVVRLFKSKTGVFQ